MAEPTSCCTVPGGYCARVDTMFNLAGVHVTDVTWHSPEEGRERLVLSVETSPGPAGCPGCGLLATAHGRRVRRLQDIPTFGGPVELVWRQRRHRCVEKACPVDGFSEDSDLAGPRAKLTRRAAWWAMSCLQSDTASVASLARRLGVDWHTSPVRLLRRADDSVRLLESGLIPVDLDAEVGARAHAADGAGHDVVQRLSAALRAAPRIRAGILRSNGTTRSRASTTTRSGVLAGCRTSSVDMQDDLAGHGSLEQGADRCVGLTPARLALDGAVELAPRDQQ